jgi:hypothetical protein
MTENVRIVKLISGEEIFGQVEEVVGLHAHALVITLPLQILMGQAQDKTTGEVKNINQVVPWAMNIEGENVTIKKVHVMYDAPANKQLVEMYRKATSKIEVPPQGIQLPR